MFSNENQLFNNSSFEILSFHNSYSSANIGETNIFLINIFPVYNGSKKNVNFLIQTLI